MNTLRTLSHLFVPTVIGVSLLGSAAAAPVPLINVNPSTDVPKPYEGFDESHGDGMVGWSFQLLEGLIVTHVGWYDRDADGLSRAFQVGLWRGKSIDGRPLDEISGWQPSSLIGDPDNGLIIASGTNATLVGTWRVVSLAEPLTLQPGSYQLGGIDTSTTPDVIKYVMVGGPSYGTLIPPGSPLVIGPFFYGSLLLPAGQVAQTNLHPAASFYLANGLELGPMLFGAKAPPQPGSGLGIGRVSRDSVFLAWPTGTLLQAELVTGPYNAVTNAASPFIVPRSAIQEFYRLDR